MGPVIEAVDAGHVSHGEHCVRDNESWPCTVIVKARVAQPKYAKQLARENAIAAGKLTAWATGVRVA